MPHPLRAPRSWVPAARRGAHAQRPRRARHLPAAQLPGLPSLLAGHAAPVAVAEPPRPAQPSRETARQGRADLGQLAFKEVGGCLSCRLSALLRSALAGPSLSQVLRAEVHVLLVPRAAGSIRSSFLQDEQQTTGFPECRLGKAGHPRLEAPGEACLDSPGNCLASTL